MGIELKVSHVQSKLGAIKPREYLVWTSLHVPYKIKYIFVNIVYHSYRILFIAVSIKNIVDMRGNKQFVKTRAHPASQVAVAKTSYATRRAAYGT